MGLESALKVQSPSLYHREQLKAVINYLNSVLQCTSLGIELEKFYKNAFMTQSPQTAPRRTRASRADAEPVDDSILNLLLIKGAGEITRTPSGSCPRQ